MAPFLRPGIRVDADDLDEMPLMDGAPTDSAGSMPGCIAIVIVGVHHELIKDDRGGRATFCGQSLLVSRCGSTSISRDPEGGKIARSGFASSVRAHVLTSYVSRR